MNKFEHGFGTQLGAVSLWRRVRSGGFMLAAWSHQTTTAGGRQKTFFLGIQKGRWGVFVDKLAQRFGTQLGAVLLWRRVRSGGLMIDSCSYR